MPSHKAGDDEVTDTAENPGEEQGGPPEDGPPDDTGDAPQPVQQLEAFSTLQRQVAGLDFTAFNALKNSISQMPALQIPHYFAAQDSLVKQFARTIDFSRLVATPEALMAPVGLSASAAHAQWVASLASSLDFSALTGAAASSAALAAYSGLGGALAETMQRQADLLTKFGQNLQLDLLRTHLDTSAWIESLDRWIPSNLRRVDDIDLVATVALDEGMPLSWIPRHEIVIDLVGAAGSDEREAILIGRSADILDDCEAALTGDDSEWARETRNAIAALRAGHDGPAQSHASNIIDSIVIALFGSNGRSEATKQAEEDFDELPLQLAAENLTIRPLFRAFAVWWPASGVAPPPHFARHATSHAVGQAGVFGRNYALVAVMLATSLTVQYSPEQQPPDEQGKHG
jgi:hypothetical protein